MSITTKFGQNLDIGSVVGWGHRSGNMSAEQVGVVIALTPYDATRWNPETRTQDPVVRHKARCVWVDDASKIYTSTTEAAGLFVLQPHSLSVELQRRINDVSMDLVTVSR